MATHTTSSDPPSPTETRVPSPSSPVEAPGHHWITGKSALAEYELEDTGRLPFILSWPEVKLLAIAGVGFFLDAYDLFIINPVATMLQYRLYGGHSLPAGLEDFIKAAANIGSVIGQFIFGFAADYFGRKAVYGKELIIIIIATILCMSTPTGGLTPSSALVYLGVFRILLGIGVGGDYPMSASIATERSNVRRRGTMLAWVFSAQGWGSFVGALVFIVVLECYKHVMNDKGETSKVDGVWRITVGLSLVPAVATLYHRLTLSESKRFKDAKAGKYNEIQEKKVGDHEVAVVPVEGDVVPQQTASEVTADKMRHFKEFFAYFRVWKHAQILLGTTTCWFFLDVAFYGINLNQNNVLQEIGFDGKTGTPWERLHKIAIGNIIITALGFVPGYYASVLLVQVLGRKWIQIQGFLLSAMFLGILAGMFNELSHAAFIVCFSFMQFFFNFGANTTTYLYPAEVFPTKFRATAHGISAACGKAGAIVSSIAFNSLSKSIGTPNVLWIFFGCSIAGAFCTLLLPEVKDRDPDRVYAEELAELRAKGVTHVAYEANF